jgi:ribosomal protein S18 acetylase RimI-like enzyme
MDNIPVIRTATPRDIPAMVPVINAAFDLEGFLEGPRTDENKLAKLMEKGDFLVACDIRGHIVASVHVELRAERGYFGMLAVDPGHQRRGLGRRMVAAVEEHCRQSGCNAMDLTVLSLRTELPPLYRKLGYLETGTEEFHPSRPLKAGVECHCIVMSKAL